MVIPPLHLRAQRRLRASLRAASGAYRWLDTPPGSTAVARAGVVVLSIVGAYVALRVYPHELPAPDGHAGLLAMILQSRPIVFVGRIAIFSVAAFAVLSIVARMWNREWLTRAGPFEIERAATAAEKANVILEQDLAHARATIRQLRTANGDLDG